MTGPVGRGTNGLHMGKEQGMTLHIEIVPLISLVAGIAILVVPKLLNYIVAIYLITLGILGLLGHGF